MIVLIYGYNVIALGNCFRKAFGEIGPVLSVGPTDGTGPSGHHVEVPGPYVPWSVLERIHRERGPIEAVVQIESGQLCLLRGVPAHTPFPVAYYSSDGFTHPAASRRFARMFHPVFCSSPCDRAYLRDNRGGLPEVVPFGGDVEAPPLPDAPKEYDVVFVGHNDAARWPRRAALLARLSARYRCLIQPAPREEAPAILARGHLAFNCTFAGFSNMRIFEVMSHGGCLLTDRLHDGVLDGLFVDGEHYLGFDDDDLEQVVDRCLEDPEQAARIGAQARREIMTRHTWTHRALQMREGLRRLRAESETFPQNRLAWQWGRMETAARLLKTRRRDLLRGRSAR